MRTQTRQTHYRLDPSARFRVLDDEGIFVLQEAEEVLVVNAVGAFIVQRLQADLAVDEVIEAVVESYDVDADRARQDTVALLEALVEAGALTQS